MSNSSQHQVVSGATNSPSQLMRRLFRLNQEYSRALGEQLEVNPTDFRVMEFLMENGAATPSSIASAIGVTAGALTQSLDRLERVGHTSRERNPSDRRSIRVVANPNSLDRVWSEIQPLIDASASVLESMSGAEQQAVSKYLKSMLDAHETKLSQISR